MHLSRINLFVRMRKQHYNNLLGQEKKSCLTNFFSKWRLSCLFLIFFQIYMICGVVCDFPTQKSIKMLGQGAFRYDAHSDEK